LLLSAAAAAVLLASILLIKDFSGRRDAPVAAGDPLEEYVRKNFPGGENLMQEVFSKLQSHVLTRGISFTARQEFPGTKPREAREIAGFLNAGKELKISAIETVLFAAGISGVFAEMKSGPPVDLRIVELLGGKNSLTSLLNKRFGILSEGRVYLPHENLVLQRENVAFREISDRQAQGYFLGLTALYHLKEADFSSATAAAESAAASFPGEPSLIFLRGHIRFLSGSKEAGIAEMETALASGEDEQGLYNLAISYAECGKGDKGIALLKRIVASNSEYLDAYPPLVQYLTLLAGQSGPERKKELLSEAAEYIEKGGAAGVDMPTLVIGRALIKLTDGKLEEATAYLEEYKNLPHVLPFLAKVLIGSGQEEKAVDYLKKALRKQPGNSGAATALYGYYLEKGSVAEAEGIMEEFLSKVTNRKLWEMDFERIRKRIEGNAKDGTPASW